MDDVARPEAGGEHRPGEAPVVEPRPLGIVDRAGRGEDAGQPGGRRGGEAAERRRRMLQRQQVGLAQDRDRVSAVRSVTLSGSMPLSAVA
ncbi:MAG: hypothetical protein U1E14_10295 [Geminicoccaceae bacterium]